MATTTTPPTGAGSTPPARKPGVAPIRPRHSSGPLIVRFYRSAVGKKWVMAVTGVILLGFVVRPPDRQPEALPLEGGDQPLRRGAPQHARRTCSRARCCCGRIRIVLILAFVFHIHSAAGLTLINRKARPDRLAVPVEARLRRRRLRVAHDALDRRSSCCCS